MNGATVLEVGIAYGLPFAMVALLYSAAGWFRSRGNQRMLEVNRKEGLTEPPSLHPVIDANRCLGCATCVTACPESDVLGLVRGKAVLVHPTHCIGHGACKVACPTDAIELVLGTERQGVVVPVLDERFETSVEGIHVAGELGGMGLIRNAIEQGRQAMAHIVESLEKKADGPADVVIVGAGPAGLSAGLAAMEAGLRYAIVDQDTIGGTVAHYPRGKIVMTAPAQLPIVGRIDLGETSKESLMALWMDIVARTGLEVRENVTVTSIGGEFDRFRVETSAGPLEARRILLAIGRRGTPRKLGVAGEELPKVVYRLVDAEQYRGQRVLVVGGGDSALEAAGAIADEDGTVVTLSYRNSAFGRAKLANRERVAKLADAGRLTARLESQVARIGPDEVEIDHGGQRTAIGNDAVIVCAGGELPTPFLTAAGIQVDTLHGRPL